MSDDSLMSGYSHWVDPAKYVADYRKGLSFVLIETMEQLEAYLSPTAKYAAFDIETEGLNPETCEIIGVSLSLDGITGVYIPIAHVNPPSLGRPALERVYQFLTGLSRVFVFNLRFDYRFMEAAGFNMESIPTYDVAQGVFLADSNQKMPSLKWSEKHFLGWLVQTYEEAVGGQLNLKYVDPVDACLGGGTRVNTVDGPLTIYEIESAIANRHQTVWVVTSQGLQRVLRVVRKGVRPIIEIALTNGESVWATPDHRFLTRIDGELYWTEAGKFVEGVSMVGIEEVLGIDLNDIPDYTGPMLKRTPTQWMRYDKKAVHPSVKWVLLAGDAEVYDLQVETQHHFSLETGIIAHNCEYAATDALGTFHLVKKVIPFSKEAGVAGRIDNDSLYPLMRFENEPTRIDIPLLSKTRDEVRERLMNLQQWIYEAAGTSFKISSRDQLSDILQSMGLNTGVYTKKGTMKTGKSQLEELIEHHEIIPWIIEYQLLHKAESSYLNPLIRQAETRPHPKNPEHGQMRFSYMTTNVPTGRLAAGKEPKNAFFADMNIQAISKPHAQDYYCKYTGGEGENCILGWEFSTDPAFSNLKIEGMSKKVNVRRAFLPEPGHVWVSIDYSAEELRIPTIMSKEPVWLNAFTNGLDIHKETAVAIFGKENYNKDSRKMAKAANFGILYGMSHYSLARRFRMSEEEAENFYNSFKASLKTLFDWVDAHTRKAKKTGTVYTLFNRPRRVRWFFRHEDSRVRGFGYRTAVNTCIQGCAADIIKITLIKLWKGVLGQPENREDAKYRSTVHDEVNFSVAIHRAHELISKLQQTMRLVIDRWPVTMEVEVSVGNSWGWMFPFRFHEGKWQPAYEVEEREEEPEIIEPVNPVWEEEPEEEPEEEEAEKVLIPA